MFFDFDLSAILDESRVLILESSKKRDVLKALIDCLARAPQVKNPRELAEGVFHREELMSTGIGMGIGVPHVRLDSVESTVMCVGICRNPVTDYESLDQGPVRLIIMIAAGKDQHTEYLRLLAYISSKLKDERLRNALIDAPDTETAYRIIVEKGK